MKKRTIFLSLSVLLAAVLLLVGLWLGLREGNRAEEPAEPVVTEAVSVAASSAEESEEVREAVSVSVEIPEETSVEESMEPSEEMSEVQEEEMPVAPTAPPVQREASVVITSPASDATPVPSTTPDPVETPAPASVPSTVPATLPSPTPVATVAPAQHEHTYEKVYWYGTPSCATANNYYNLICTGCGENGGDGEDTVAHTPKSTSYESVDGCRIYRIVEAYCEVCEADLGREETFLREEHDWLAGMTDPVWNEELQDFVSREITYCGKCYREK